METTLTILSAFQKDEWLVPSSRRTSYVQVLFHHDFAGFSSLLGRSTNSFEPLPWSLHSILGIHAADGSFSVVLHHQGFCLLLYLDN